MSDKSCYAVLWLHPSVMPDTPIYNGRNLTYAADAMLGETICGTGPTPEEALEAAKNERVRIWRMEHCSQPALP